MYTLNVLYKLTSIYDRISIVEAVGASFAGEGDHDSTLRTLFFKFESRKEAEKALDRVMKLSHARGAGIDGPLPPCPTDEFKTAKQELDEAGVDLDAAVLRLRRAASAVRRLALKGSEVTGG